MPVIHDCTRPEFDDGLPFRCKCFRRVSLDEAQEWIRDGHACLKKQRRADGRVIEVKGEIVLRREKHPPSARTIDKASITRAFAEGNKREQERIAAYGLMEGRP